MPANPQSVPRICPSEFPTAPIAEIVCDRFDMAGSDQVGRPTVHQSATPRVFRLERHGELSMGDHGHPCGVSVRESMGPAAPIARRSDHVTDET